MSNVAPSAKTMVTPIAKSGITSTWDPDIAHMDPDKRPAQYQNIHLPHEPMTTPRIAVNTEGVRYPDTEDLQPRLAESWEPSPDYREWTIKLRPGVKSHAGNTLSADDVKWSWERAYALRGVGLWRTRRMGGVDSASDVSVVDGLTVRFKLSGPNPEFPQYLAFATNNVFDSTEAKKHTSANDPWGVEWLAHNVAGYGAFSLASQGGNHVVFEARDDYYLGRPGLDRVVLVGAESREDGLRMVENGEANFLMGLYPEELSRFEGRPGYQIIRVHANHSTLEMNWQEAPFDDVKVRQAVCYALPYDKIIQDVYMGKAQRSTSPIPSVSKYHTGEFNTYNTDLNKAKELMAASSHPEGFATQLYIGPSYESMRFGEIVRQALAPLGITVEVRLWTSLPPGTKVPMWFKEECGHALYEPMYDLGHDYDPPLGMWGGRNIRDKLWTDRIRAIRRAEAKDQPELYRNIQRDIMEFAPCAHVAEGDTGWVIRGEIDPWALGPQFLGAETTVWSAHRQIMPWW